MLREALEKHNYKQKMSKTRSFLKLFLWKFNTPGAGGSFSVLISRVFGAGWYYLVV